MIVTTPFRRAGVASYTDANGMVQIAAIDVLRNQYYVGGVLQPPLIEAAATNFALWTEDWSNAIYSKTNVAVSANGANAPDGNATADILTRTSTVANVQVTQSVGALGQGITYTLSLFAKANLVGGQLGMRLQSPYPTRADAVFDLAAGTIKGTNANGYTNVSAAMIALGNGWYRCSLTGTQPNNNATFILVAPTDASRTVGSFEGNTTSLCDAQVWGTQLEVGAAASSYIPTTNAAASRAADIDQMFAATANGYSRQIGSFLTEGFLPRMMITPVGFASNPVDMIASVTDLQIFTNNARAIEAAVAGRSITSPDMTFAPAHRDATVSLVTSE